MLPEQKKQAVLEAIGDSKDRFWIIFSHIYPREEDEVILATLEDTYRIVMSYSAENGAALLLEQR